MKKSLLILLIIFLILITTLIKNSSKRLETQIYNKSENISILKEKFEYNQLENNYLSSPKKLINYLKFYQINNYISLDITNLKILKKKNNNFIIRNLVNNE